MINLLPPNAKKDLRREYWFRVLSVWLFIWSIALFAGAIAMLPVQVLISTQTDVSEKETVSANEKVTDYANLSKALVQSSLKAKQVLDQGLVPPLSDYISRFQNLAGLNIQINSINISRGKEGINPVSINGIANNRQALASFRDSLLVLDEVSEVDLPISNLAKDKDIDFNLTITINKDKAYD